jgi:polysaccharide biosynthesis protein PslG
MRMRKWLAPMAAMAAGLALPATAAASHTSTHILPAYGIGALKTEWQAGDGTTADPNGLADLKLMGDNGMTMYRARFRRDRVLANGSYSEWRQLDQLTREASLQGVTLQPVLIDMPGEVYTAPKTTSARRSFASFAEAATRRYGPNGSFWSSCGCPSRPIKVWEVWNEANMYPYWDLPNPSQYGQLVKEVRSKLRRADPTARILLGGLAYGGGYNTTTRLEPNAFLRSVIQTTGRNGFDALALHSYHTSAINGVNTAIGGTVNTLKTYGGTEANGSPRHQVWINEFGRTTRYDDPATPDVNEQATSEESQRQWLENFLTTLLPHRSDWNLGPVMWYSLRNSHEPTENWLRLGLRHTNADDTDGGVKPAWGGYVSRSSARELLELPKVR